MKLVYFITLVTIALLFFLYDWKLKNEEKNKKSIEKNGFKKYIPLILLLGIGFLFKSYCTTFMQGYTTDVNCFTAWSEMIYSSGIGKFYYLDAFTDYPPGFMYVLYVIAGFRHLFGIPVNGDAGVYLIKLIPILCDLGAGFLIYQIARKRFSDNASLLLCSAYIFNPVIMINSSFWCQVDSIWTLLVLLTGYLCMEEKRIAAYFVFALGILFKPQMLVFTPILIFTIIDQVFLHDFNWKKFFFDIGSGLGAILLLFLSAMPFGLEKVIAQYCDTLGSYQYASVNAYNFWNLLGQNWKPQTGKLLGIEYRHWGELAIVVAVFLGALIFFKIKDESRYFLSMAVIICTMFIFSVRMHERYMYPALVLLLVGYILSKKREYYYCFIGFTVTQFLNTAHVLYYSYKYDSTATEGKLMGFTAVILILVFLYMVYSCLRKEPVEEETNKAATSKTYRKSKKKVVPEAKSKIRPSKLLEKMTKIDYLVMFGIMAVYTAFAFCDLGYSRAPETSFDSTKDGTEIVLDLGQEKSVSQIYTYLGNYENRNFRVEAGGSLDQMVNLGDFSFTSVFNWEKSQELPPFNARYIRMTSLDTECVLFELAILDSKNELIEPVNAKEYSSLFDEQALFDPQDTFRSGTYFDEIYHARTAYEMTKHIYCYENTHPPLGKFIISIGVRIFGMNPFGWRFMGTLFGVLMLPFMYMFGKRMFNKTWVAGVIMSLFAFDFMHFVQTRIATIDVYGTFFIIAMYYFMYRYAQTSFYDNKLSKTFIPLGLSGLCMGLGMASKWTAIYAAAGLGIIFFYIMFIRYREYRYAKAHIKESTGEIRHEDVVNKFTGNLIKTLAICLVFFVAIPALIYYLSYLSFSDGSGDSVLTQLIRNQQTMFSYHSTLVAEHPYSSWWYEWPVMIRPVFYYCNTLANGLREGISAFGNPLVWWAGIPALCYMFYLIIWKRDRNALFITFSYFAQYVPWMFVTRITFAYHYFPSVVFVVLMIGYCMHDYVKDKPERIKYVVGYAIAAFLLFLMFYPVLSGQPIDMSYVEHSLRWKGLHIQNYWIPKLDWVLVL